MRTLKLLLFSMVFITAGVVLGVMEPWKEKRVWVDMEPVVEQFLQDRGGQMIQGRGYTELGKPMTALLEEWDIGFKVRNLQRGDMQSYSHELLAEFSRADKEIYGGHSARGGAVPYPKDFSMPRRDSPVGIASSDAWEYELFGEGSKGFVTIRTRVYRFNENTKNYEFIDRNFSRQTQSASGFPEGDYLIWMSVRIGRWH